MTGRGLLRIFTSMAMLALAWQVAGGEEVLDLLARADIAWLLAALGLTVPMQVLSALRWSVTSGRLGNPLPMRRAVAEYYLASLINMTLPGGVTGDAARIWRQGQRIGGYRRAAHGVLLERSTGQAALVVVMLAGLAVNPRLLELLVLSQWLAPALAVLAVLVTTLFVAARRWPPLQDLVDDAGHAWWPARVLLIQLLLSLAVVACYLLVFAASAAALGVALSATTALLAIPLVLTAMALPISVGGTGPRELSAAALWPLLGMDAAAGAATALVYGLVVLTGSLPGAAVLARSPSTGRPGHHCIEVFMDSAVRAACRCEAQSRRHWQRWLAA